MASRTAVPVLLALLIGGCPKRQTTPRIVYVQPPPPASAPGADSGSTAPAEALIIQEPEPLPSAEPPPESPPPAPGQQASQGKKPVRSTRPASHPPEEKLPAEIVPPDVAPESPIQLQLQGDAAQEAELEKRLKQIDADLNDIARRTDLSQDQQRTIRDADTFRTQSMEALRQHDRLRANQLAEKAELLIRAVLGRP